MGVVYEVRDRELGIPLALKTLSEFDPERLRRLKSEFRSLLEVRHPNLVRLGELAHAAGTWFYTMELVEGQHVLDYVWRLGPRPLEIIRDSETRDVARTLDNRDVAAQRTAV